MARISNISGTNHFPARLLADTLLLENRFTAKGLVAQWFRLGKSGLIWGLSEVARDEKNEKKLTSGG